MRARPFWFNIGSYRLQLPAAAVVTAKAHVPEDDESGSGSTIWVMTVGRFHFSAKLTDRPLGGLKYDIDSETRSDVAVESVAFNGIQGVTHGSYKQPGEQSGTWIDWWFRKGDLTLCLCLRSAFPDAVPTQQEIDQHSAIVQSLQSCSIAL